MKNDIIPFSLFEKSSEIKGFKTNIEEDTVSNENFRKVLYTAKNMQLVLMTLKPGEEIGEEIHKENDQFFRFESGTGKVIVNNTTYKVKDGDCVIIPMNSKHNIINNSEDEDLKMYTIYAAPHHKDKIIRKTKKDAEKGSPEFDGKTTE